MCRVTLYVLLRSRDKGTLYELSCPYFLVKLTRRVMGHFVMLIRISMWLIGLFGFCVLFSHFRTHDATLGNSFSQICGLMHMQMYT